MKNNLFHKIFTIIFFLFWFGFLIFAAYICLRDENYGMLLYSGLFLIAGIVFAKKKLFNTNKKKNKIGIPPFGMVLLVISWITLLVSGVGLLIQGFLQKEFGLLFMGFFFFFGAIAFLLGILTFKGFFDNCKIDILGLYVGVFFVLCGGGFGAMIIQQGFNPLVIIPGIMVLAGVVQIVKCFKNKREK